MIGLEFVRTANNMSCVELAKMLDVSKSTISIWESKKKPIPKSRLKQLAEIFNVSEDFLSKDVTRLDKLEYEHKQIDNNGIFKTSNNQYIVYDDITQQIIQNDIYEEKLIQKLRNIIAYDIDDEKGITFKQSEIKAIAEFFNLLQIHGGVYMLTILRAIKYADLNETDFENLELKDGVVKTIATVLHKQLEAEKAYQQQEEEEMRKLFDDSFE